MKFVSHEDIEAPVGFVFKAVTDFTGHERAALRRGADVQRLNATVEPGPGASWNVAFHYHGKIRRMIARITRCDHLELVEFAGVSDGFELTLQINLLALSPRRTRLTMSLDLRPRSLGARLMLQSAKLGRSRLKHRYDEKLRAYAQRIETRAALSVI